MTLQRSHTGASPLWGACVSAIASPIFATVRAVIMFNVSQIVLFGTVITLRETTSPRSPRHGGLAPDSIPCEFTRCYRLRFSWSLQKQKGPAIYRALLRYNGVNLLLLFGRLVSRLRLI